MNSKELQDISSILRRDSISMTTAAGSGHPTSCLSCAEILSCLFFDEMSYDVKDPFNPDNDEFILSKGHAAPILYSALKHAGCIKDDLQSLRKFGSKLEGHPLPSALNWIKVATGSLGQGLSVGVGMALASKLQKRKFRVFVLLGDSEMAEGSNYEAMQLAKHYELNNLVAIVDVNRLGQRGETLAGWNIQDYKKRFEGFGWNVLTINGHDVEEIKKALSNANLSNSKSPTIILAKTVKGKGVSFLENKEGWHGRALDENEKNRALKEIPSPKLPSIKIKKPTTIKSTIKSSKLEFTKYSPQEEIATREAYGNILANLAKSNNSVIALDAEVSNSTKSEEVKKNSPQQFVECYIAEQNMVGMALGLSKKGFNVFSSSFSAFLSRAHDQIRIASLSSPKNLTFVGSHAGISIGEDGATQMGLEDIAMFRALSESTIFYPSDAVSTEKLTELASKTESLNYIRLTRSKTPVIYKPSENFKVGEFKVLKESSKDKAVLVSSGITLHESLKAYNEIKKFGKDVAVIDLYCIKPFNGKKFFEFVKKHGNKIVVTEDHYEAGGIGEMLLSESQKNNSDAKLTHLCVKKTPHSGPSKKLMKEHEIDSSAIIKALNKV